MTISIPEMEYGEESIPEEEEEKIGKKVKQSDLSGS